MLRLLLPTTITGMHGKRPWVQTVFWDYVEKNNITVYQDGAFDGVTAQQLDDTMTLAEAAIDSAVAAASWNCICRDRRRVRADLDKMVEDAMALGAQGYY